MTLGVEDVSLQWLPDNTHKAVVVSDLQAGMDYSLSITGRPTGADPAAVSIDNTGVITVSETASAADGEMYSISAAGQGIYSGTVSASFRLTLSGIVVVSGLNPADGSTTWDTMPTFSWDAVPGAAGYELRIADSQAEMDSASLVSVTGISHRPMSALTNLQTHYWQVRAKNGTGQFGGWSDAHSLRVESDAVSGLSPADGSTTLDTTPTLSWDAVPGAAGYEVRIAESLDGLASAQSINVAGTSHTPTAALASGQTHYWQVRAKDGAGQYGAWTAVHSLEVAMPQGFVLVAGGTFQMGSTNSDAESNESPVHSVTVDSFYMAETEVTFDQYDAYCAATGANQPDDGGFGRGNHPVMNVTWYDAVNYCNWLSGQEGLTPAYEVNGTAVSWNQSANGYRLPTEAEWEYAARGGSQSQGYKYAGSNDVDEVGWYKDNSGSKPQPVKGKKANELGLYDMSGNVYEWCWDWYDNYSSGFQTNPTGPSSGSKRVARGGGWSSYVRPPQSVYRGRDSPSDSRPYLGFRPVRRTN